MRTRWIHRSSFVWPTSLQLRNITTRIRRTICLPSQSPSRARLGLSSHSSASTPTATLLPITVNLWDFKHYNIIPSWWNKTVTIELEFSTNQIAYTERHRDIYDWTVYSFGYFDTGSVRSFIERPGVWKRRKIYTVYIPGSSEYGKNVYIHHLRSSVRSFQWRLHEHALINIEPPSVLRNRPLTPMKSPTA